MKKSIYTSSDEINQIGDNNERQANGIEKEEGKIK